jgi:hypothetical protein
MHNASVQVDKLMSETGFGSVTYDPAPDLNDAGFGSPYIAQGRDAGFGSPYDPALSPLELLKGGEVIGDDGGTRLDIAGVWYTLAPEPVPSHSSAFTVHFIHTVTNTVTPALAGSLGGTGGQVFTDLAQKIIHAYVPPLAHGSYNIRVTHRTGVIFINNAFRVITRTRAAEVYGLRKALPSFYKCGAVTAVNETLDELPQYTNLEALTRSIGEVLNRFTGRRFTLLSQQWVEGQAVLHVESTLDFADSGAVTVGDMRFTYTGKTDSTFTGVAPVSGHALASIPLATKVVPYDKPR